MMSLCSETCDLTTPEARTHYLLTLVAKYTLVGMFQWQGLCHDEEHSELSDFLWNCKASWQYEDVSEGTLPTSPEEVFIFAINIRFPLRIVFTVDDIRVTIDGQSIAVCARTICYDFRDIFSLRIRHICWACTKKMAGVDKRTICEVRPRIFPMLEGMG